MTSPKDDAARILARTAIHRSHVHYLRHPEIPEETRLLGNKRLCHGLHRYGQSAFAWPTESAWLHEALEELLDAFNMLGGMREARGESAICLDELATCISTVQTRIDALTTSGTGVPPVSASDQHHRRDADATPEAAP